MLRAVSKNVERKECLCYGNAHIGLPNNREMVSILQSLHNPFDILQNMRKQ